MTPPGIISAIEELKEQIAANSLLVGRITLTDLGVKNITAATGYDLSIFNATGKDIKVVFTDNAGARSWIFLDSDGTPVATLDSNGLFTAVGGFVGNVSGIETLTAKAATDLQIIADGDEDLILKMGDAAGVNKILFKDSANALQASLDSDGTFTAKKLVGPVTYVTTDTDGAPTNAECVSGFGAAATVGAGFIGIYQDSHASGKAYVCVSNGATYSVAELTAAA